MIPKILHRIWLGDAEMPADYLRHGEAWRRLHPDWDIVTWRDGTLPPLRNQRLFDAAGSAAQRADIARYELLHRIGGVYVDCDIEPLRPLDPLLEGVRGFAAREDDTWVCNAVLGGEPRHPFFDQLVAMLPSWKAAHEGEPVNVQTGPHLVTALLRADARLFRPPLFTVFEPVVFYPFGALDGRERTGPFPDSYAVHHWAGSWAEQPLVVGPTGPLRILLAVNWSDAPHPDPLLARFVDLFSSEAPVELALPLLGAAPETALEHLAAQFAALGVHPERVGPVVLYTDEEVASLPCAAVVLRDGTAESQAAGRAAEDVLTQFAAALQQAA